MFKNAGVLSRSTGKRRGWFQRLIAMVVVAILAGAIVDTLALPAYAGVDDYPTAWRNAPLDSFFDPWGMYNRECVSFVAWRLHSRNGYEMPFHDDALNWGPRARARGVTVDRIPTVGSVAWYAYGHVAWVEAVNGDGTIIVEEYNWRVGTTHDGAYHRRTTLATTPTGFIHFKDSGTPLSDGVFVNHGGHVYRIVGGAPIYVSGWAVFGGSQPTITLSDTQWSRLPHYPRDGSFVQAFPSGQVFRISGGAPLYVSTWTTYGGPQSAVTIGDDDIRNAKPSASTDPWSHLKIHPANGAFVTAQPSGRVYRFDQGAPGRITDWASVGGQHPSVTVGDETILRAGTTDQSNPFSHLRARLSGSDRFASSAMMSAESFAPGRPVVYIANGLNFPDALSGASVAAKNGAPVLLVSPTGIPAVIQTELSRLRPAKIVVLGGPLSVGDAVERQLGTFTTGPVSRLFGADRYATSAAVSAANFTPGLAVAYVSSGLNFPDALSGAPVAAKNHAPVLLVPPGAVPAAIQAELTRLRPGRIVILGGTNSVSAAVQTRLASLTPGTVTRLSGNDRFSTSAAISAASSSPGLPVVYLSSGLTFPDALSGTPVASKNGAPILLVDPHGIPAPIRAELSRLHPDRIVVLGGGNVVPGDILP